MKQAEDTKTAELPGLSRRGRRPLGDRAMTPAERQKAYRERQRMERYETNPADMSRVTMIDQLSAALKAMDDMHELSDGAGQIAENIVAEIVTRYGLRAKRLNALVKAAAARST